MMTEVAVPDLGPALAEVFLAIAAMVVLMAGVFADSDRAYGRTQALAGVAMLIAGALVAIGATGERVETFGGLFVSDNFSAFMKMLVVAGALGGLAVSGPYLRDQNIARFEVPVLFLLSVLGMFIMISANNLMSLYVGLELQSLALYVLAAINRDRNRSTEAGLKYFVLGALSSGLMLYGISLVYGFSGTMDFDVMAAHLHHGHTPSLGLIVGMVFLITGLSFKVSAVPFHMWTPDVYEGAPTPITAFFAAAPKAAAMALFIRVMMGAFGDAVSQWQQILVFISIASMLVGAFVALVQTNIKRLMAYSSIGHIGYALVGLAAGSTAGIEAVVLYIAIYVTMTLGAFGAILAMRRDGVQLETIDDLSGLSKTNLPLAVAVLILMFSLAGIPFLFGFWGKFFVFKAALDAGLVSLVVIGLVTSVVSCYYYLRIIKIMFFDEADGALDAVSGRGVKAVIALSALINSPVHFLFMAPLAAASGWAALSFV